MRDERHDRAKLRVLRVEEGSQEQREHEQDKQNRGIPDDRPKRHDRNPHERARRLASIAIRERLDEHVAHDHEDRHDGREDDLREDDRAPSSTRHVARELLRRVSQPLLLVPRDHRARETTVADPRVRVRARVAAVHPPQELAVVDDEVGEGELVRVEEEGRDT